MGKVPDPLSQSPCWQKKALGRVPRKKETSPELDPGALEDPGTWRTSRTP